MNGHLCAHFVKQESLNTAKRLIKRYKIKYDVVLQLIVGLSLRELTGVIFSVIGWTVDLMVCVWGHKKISS